MLAAKKYQSLTTTYMDLNKAMIIGNVTRDPESRTTPNGAQVANFSVATNLIWSDQQGKRQERVEFHNIVAWRKLAEICTQYLKKGSRVYIEGRLQTRSWDDPTGVKKYRTELVADNLIMLDRANASGGNNTQPFTPNMSGQQSPQQNQEPAEEEINVDEIPF